MVDSRTDEMSTYYFSLAGIVRYVCQAKSEDEAKKLFEKRYGFVPVSYSIEAL